MKFNRRLNWKLSLVSNFHWPFFQLAKIEFFHLFQFCISGVTASSTITANGLQAWNVGLFGAISVPPERKVAARSELWMTTEPPYILCLLLGVVIFSFLSILWLIVVWKWWFWFLNFFHFSSWIFCLKTKKLPSCKTCFSAFLPSKTACLQAFIFAFPTFSNVHFSSFPSNISFDFKIFPKVHF